MSEVQLDTVRLQRCVERWQGGDRAAADELLRAVEARLKQLTRKMLRGFPNVQDWADTGDVLQNSLLRLLNTLRKLSPESTRHFFNLAATQVRRELLDLARHFAGRPRPVAAAEDSSGASPGLAAVPDQAAPSRDDLEAWCRFHEAIDRLDAEEREVLSLRFYHGWTQDQMAELFQVDVRTIRNRWNAACVKLHRMLRGQLPPL